MRMRTTKMFGVSALAAVLFLSVAPASEAQAQVVESNWLPWVGCWEGAGIAQSETDNSLLVCFRPVEGGSAVESLTYSEGALLGSEILRAGGAPVTISEGGCAGTRVMEWSADRRRIYSLSEMNCGGDATRSTRGVFTFVPSGLGWSEVLAVHAGGSTPLLEIRSFVPANPALLIQLGIANPASGIELAVNTARLRAGTALDMNAITELVSKAGPSAASGVLVERGDVLDPDAAMLRTLARGGVPSEILDLVVALSYPNRFQVAGGSAAAIPEAPAAERAINLAAVRPVAPWGSTPRIYSSWGRGRYGDYTSTSAFFGGSSYWGYPVYGYDAYGYFPYAGSYGSYRPPRYIVVQPPVVVNPGPSVPAIPPARVDRDGGFSGGGSGTPAAPRSQGSNAAPRSSPESTSAPAAAPASSSGGSTSEPRRAVPRP